MAIKLNSNFDYRGSNPNFERDVVETFEELKNLSGYPDGHLVYCKETKLHYKYNEELESEETGKFEEFKTGGGIEIVSSVEELDPDAEQGSLASVVENGVVKLFVKNETGWEQYSELVDQSVITEKVADSAITVEKLSTDVQDKFTAIESQLTSKSTSIDFGANEDTTTLAIMDPSVITKIKTMNVSNLYISYGDVIKQEIDLSLNEQNIDLGEADFIVINITRTTDEIDAALGLTFINKTV